MTLTIRVRSDAGSARYRGATAFADRIRFEGAAHPAPFPSCVAVWRGHRQGPLRVGTMTFREDGA